MCYVLLGGTAAASKENFMTWIDNIIIEHGGRMALVKKIDGTPRCGMYQSLTLAQFLRIESELSAHRAWFQQALNAQLWLLKMKSFTNFGSSTHYREKMWCVEFSFIIASYYVPLSPLANQVYVNS